VARDLNRARAAFVGQPSGLRCAVADRARRPEAAMARDRSRRDGGGPRLLPVGVHQRPQRHPRRVLHHDGAVHAVRRRRRRPHRRRPRARARRSAAGLVPPGRQAGCDADRVVPPGYWPDPADEPRRSLSREAVTLVTDDGAVVRGTLTAPTTQWKSAVVLGHPRADFSVHYASSLLASAGYAVLGFATRYVNNDVDCQHEKLIDDVAAVV